MSHRCGDHLCCKHCGMPMDQPTLNGECPHCADIYPHDDPHPNNATRCDGCGHQRAKKHCVTIERYDETVGDYCRGCRQILDETDTEPGEHEQYTLMEG